MVIESGTLPHYTSAMETPPGITLTNAQLESVAQGLSALDGLQLKDGFTPFKYDDETTWRLAEAGEAITRAVSVLTASRKSLARQHGVTEHMRVTPENSPNVSAFMDGLDALLARQVVLPFEKLSRSKLNVGQGDKKNAIPPGVLARLMPVLE